MQYDDYKIEVIELVIEFEALSAQIKSVFDRLHSFYGKL